MVEWLCSLTMEEWRDLVLIVLSPLALGFGMWRTISAHFQERHTKRSLANDEYRAARELLGHRNVAVRLGAVMTLADFAREDIKKYHIRVMKLFVAFLMWPPTFDGGPKKGFVDFRSPDTVEIVRTINERSSAQKQEEQDNDFDLADRLSSCPFPLLDATEINIAQCQRIYKELVGEKVATGEYDPWEHTGAGQSPPG